MFGAVVVHLQRQAGPRLDRDVLDLEAPAHVHRVVRPPRTINFAVVLGFAATLFVQGVDHLFDTLNLVFVGNHHRVFGFHHHDVVQADHRHQFAVAMDHAVGAVLNHHVAFAHVAIGVFLIDIPQRRPAAHIAPTGRQRHDAGALGFFHHGVVNRVVRAAGECGVVDVHGVGVLLAAFQGQQAGVVDVRIVFFQFLQKAAGAEHEHAAVPEIAATFDEFGSPLGVGFFNKGGNTAHAFGQQGVGGGLDVAIAGLGFERRNPKQHHFAAFGGDGGQREGALQGFLIFQHVVGRQHQHQLVAAFVNQHHRGQGNSGRRVTAERLH